MCGQDLSAKNKKKWYVTNRVMYVTQRFYLFLIFFVNFELADRHKYKRKDIENGKERKRFIVCRMYVRLC